MTAARRPRPGHLMTIPARPLRALQHLNDELMHASEALVCSAHIPQARPRPGTEPADKAA